jgi:hypothetical protein
VYLVSLSREKPRAIAPPGFALTPFGNPISPDGARVALVDANNRSFLANTEGSAAPAPISGLDVGEFPIEWSADGRYLYSHRAGGLPARVWKVEIATGRRELFRDVSPADPVGVTSVESILLTPDGRELAYCYRHNLSDLYVLSGLK